MRFILLDETIVIWDLFLQDGANVATPLNVEFVLESSDASPQASESSSLSVMVSGAEGERLAILSQTVFLGTALKEKIALEAMIRRRIGEEFLLRADAKDREWLKLGENTEIRVAHAYEGVSFELRTEGVEAKTTVKIAETISGGGLLLAIEREVGGKLVMSEMRQVVLR